MRLSRHFKPPKRSDKAQWEKVRRLIDAGFRFEHLYQPGDAAGHQERIPYPEELREVEAFIERFRNRVTAR